MVNQIGVLGAGIMGHSIAWLALTSGYPVTLYDNSNGALEKGMNKIKKLASKADAAANLEERLKITSDLGHLKEVEFVIEAVTENLAVKTELFQSLEGICKPSCIFASNTSALSITEISSCLNNKARFVGMHFFNPPYIMKLVEIIKGYDTSRQTLEAAREFVQSLGRKPVVLQKDSPGFIVNRILTAQIIEAIKLVQEGVASPEDIDQAVRYGLNYPLGPFALQDLIGLDSIASVLAYFEKELDAKWKIPQDLSQLVKAGRLGQKSGSGWYDYGEV